MAAGLVVYVVSCIVVGVVAGAVWQSKGGTFWGGFWFGALLHLLGLFYVGFAHLPPTLRDQPVVGDGVVLTKDFHFLTGMLPKGYRREVLATDVIDGTS